MSITLKLSSDVPILHARYFPPIVLERDSELSLLSLVCWHSIKNVDETNNCFYYDNDKMIKIPVGCYEITDINKYLQREMKSKLSAPLTDDEKLMGDQAVLLEGNRHTLHSEITCRYPINFMRYEKNVFKNNIGTLLGFEDVITKPFEKCTSNKPVNILKVQVIRVSCNIASNSYDQDQPSHVIYEFFPNVAPGFKVVENPRQLIYHKLNTRVISEIEVRFTDQSDQLLNFRGEVIHLRLHIRPCQ